MELFKVTQGQELEPIVEVSSTLQALALRALRVHPYHSTIDISLGTKTAVVAQSTHELDDEEAVFETANATLDAVDLVNDTKSFLLLASF